MEKSWLIGRMESLLAVREYNYDGSWLDCNDFDILDTGGFVAGNMTHVLNFGERVIGKYFPVGF